MNDCWFLEQSLLDLFNVPDHFQSIDLKLLDLDLIDNLIVLIEGAEQVLRFDWDLFSVIQVVKRVRIDVGEIYLRLFQGPRRLNLMTPRVSKEDLHLVSLSILCLRHNRVLGTIWRLGLLLDLWILQVFREMFLELREILLHLLFV